MHRRKCLSGHYIILQIMAIATKTDNLTLIPGIQMVERALIPQAVL